MIKVEFVGLIRSKAIRKALSFWYKEYKDYWTLKEFLSRCTWKQGENETVVVFRGPAPSKNKVK